MFFAIVTLDEIRIREKRYDILPCIKTSQELPKPRKNCQKFLSINYFDFLMRTPVKVVVLGLYVGMFICSCLGLRSLKLGLDPRVAVTQGGNMDQVFISLKISI